MANELIATTISEGEIVKYNEEPNLYMDAEWAQTVEDRHEQFFLKKDWGDGPWQQEPDRISFQAYGLDCLMVRHPSMGQWCGYVAVPRLHPLYGKHYDKASRLVDVHGGFTYARQCDGDVLHGICHLTHNDDKAHWFGFDCAHLGDEVPSIMAMRRPGGILHDIDSKYQKASKAYADCGISMREADTYKNATWVRLETVRAARQISKVNWLNCHPRLFAYWLRNQISWKWWAVKRRLPKFRKNGRMM